LRHITVFCGASNGHRPEYRTAAAQLGRALAERGLGLVYGGADIGLMGEVADAVLDAGGTVTGVIPEGLVKHEVAHAGLTQLHVVRDMHERKATMAALGDAFIALPGGFGTAEELFEIVTWMQLGLHHKPSALVDVNNYYSPLLTWLYHCADEGFVHRQYLDHLVVATDPTEVLDRVLDHVAPPQHLFSGSAPTNSRC
jgi:uncharacterized protein (TIGR00730 family)